jgi:hypothetical protein
VANRILSVEENLKMRKTVEIYNDTTSITLSSAIDKKAKKKVKFLSWLKCV